MRMSEMKYNSENGKQQLAGFGGINYSSRYKVGELLDSQNLSADEYPWISQRKNTEVFGATTYSNPQAICNARDKLCVVDYKSADEGGNIYYDGVLADGSGIYSIPTEEVALVGLISGNYDTSGITNPQLGDKLFCYLNNKICTYNGTEWDFAGGTAPKTDVKYTYNGNDYVWVRMLTPSTISSVYSFIRICYLRTMGIVAPADAGIEDLAAGDKYCFHTNPGQAANNGQKIFKIYTYNGSAWDSGTTPVAGILYYFTDVGMFYIWNPYYTGYIINLEDGSGRSEYAGCLQAISLNGYVLSDQEKQLIPFGDKVMILPDRLYYTLTQEAEDEEDQDINGNLSAFEPIMYFPTVGGINRQGETAKITINKTNATITLSVSDTSSTLIRNMPELKHHTFTNFLDYADNYSAVGHYLRFDYDIPCPLEKVNSFYAGDTITVYQMTEYTGWNLPREDDEPVAGLEKLVIRSISDDGMTLYFDAGALDNCTGLLHPDTVDHPGEYLYDYILHGWAYIEGTAAGYTYDSQNGFYIKREVPGLDYACEHNNRLWGVNNEERTIYGSALGKPLSFYDYGANDSTASYAVAVGSNGDFTGSIGYDSYVCFFKEKCLHKLYGSKPNNFQLVTGTIAGVEKGAHKSMQVINDCLYYKGIDGIYAYSGGTPDLISDNLGTVCYDGGIAGTDGRRYYISMNRESNYNDYDFFVYDTLRGIWLRIDDSRIADFTFLDKNLFYLIRYDRDYVHLFSVGDSPQSNKIYGFGSDNKIINWNAELCPFYEDTQQRKSYLRLHIRYQPVYTQYYPLGGNMLNIYKKAHGVDSDFVLMKSINITSSTAEKTIEIPLPPNRCDSFSIKFTGTGRCRIKSLIREYQKCSER